MFYTKRIYLDWPDYMQLLRERTPFTPRAKPLSSWENEAKKALKLDAKSIEHLLGKQLRVLPIRKAIFARGANKK
jgi:hypothetical protein